MKKKTKANVSVKKNRLNMSKVPYLQNILNESIMKTFRPGLINASVLIKQKNI